MLVLHKYNAAWGVPDISPFCVKVETYLRMTQVPFRCELGDPRKAPKGKLPFIEHDGRTVADSSAILAYLKQQFGDAIDDGLSARERALCTAVQSMVEEHLYFVVVHERWQQDEGWATYTPTMRDYAQQVGIPGMLQPLVLPVIRRGAVARLRGQGLGAHSPEEVAQIGIRLVDALSELLGDGPYFCGERVRTIDATLYAFIAILLLPPFESTTRAHALTKPNLEAYRARLEAEFYSPGAAATA